jgi:RIO-like serine/threonine protein kinase
MKRDTFGTIALSFEGHEAIVVRDTRPARWWAGWLARRLARREACALRAVGHAAGMPQLLSFDGRVLTRTYLHGAAMQASRPASSRYYRNALTLLRRLHRSGVAHNDLAKEPNWLCMLDGDPAIIDFQLAHISVRRGKLFRILAREDLRHLLKHKRSYLPDRLTQRQRAMLATPSWGARTWRALVKPPYLWFTRRALGWTERNGPTERQT